jgi:hypothetical protein
MPVTVAEYLGVRSSSATNIVPILNLPSKPTVACPFRNAHCSKARKGQQPICSVRDSNSNIWIVCEHRLCATTPKIGAVNDHQKNILEMVAKAIYGQQINANDILVKREVEMPITASSDYKADYVMWRENPTLGGALGGDRAAIVEMQGGGETAGTEKITAHVKQWAASAMPTNQILSQPTSAVPLVTNAWRRQQEQFLVKGSVAALSGAKMVFCVGSLIYDYLKQRLTTVNLQDLSTSNWTLALVAFIEDPNGIAPACAPDSIQLALDPTRTMYTNYFSFVQALTNQGAPQPQVFSGQYFKLNGQVVNV